MIMIKKILTILVAIAIAAGLVGCGGGNSSSVTPTGVNPGVVSRVDLMATSYVNQMNSYCYFKAKVIDGNGVPISNEQVIFTNLSQTGVLDHTTALTDLNGIATVTLYSTSFGFATIRAEVNTGTEKIADKKTVYFSVFDIAFPTVPAAPDLSSITLTSDNYILFETPTDTDANITATVTDSNGQPGFNRAVTFGADSPEVSFPLGSSTTNPVVHTDINGKASVLARVSPTVLTATATTVNITASAVTDTKTVAGILTLFLKPVTINTITVTANPSTVVSAGTSTISARVATTAGNPPPAGTIVNFATSVGNITPFSPTDTNGVATATFTAPTTTINTSATITASVGGTSGSTVVNVTGAPIALSVIPDIQTIANPAVGNTATYTILGGTAPYTAVSDNPALVQVSVTGHILTAMVAGIPTVNTTVTISVFDATGTKVTATLILAVPPLIPLSVIPDTQTIGNPVIGNTATYHIQGGIAPYTAFSDTPAFVTVPVAVSGSTVTATVVGIPLINTTVTISIFDAAGTKVSAKLILAVPPVVPPIAMTVIPGTQTMPLPLAVGQTATYTVIGGIAPFSVFSDTPNVASATVSGSTVTAMIASVPASSTVVTFSIYDATGTKVDVTLRLNIAGGGGGAGVMLIQPSSASVVGITGSNTDSLSFVITGGTSPFNCISNNTAIIPSPGSSPLVSFTTDPNAVLVSTLVTITCTDAKNTTATAAITVNPAPFSITMDVTNVIGSSIHQPSDKVTVTVAGGTGPYIVQSSNPALTPPGIWSSITPPIVPMPGSFVFDTNSVGQTTVVTLTAYDNTGLTATKNLTIFPQNNNGNPVISIDKTQVVGLTAPSASDNITVTVTGGLPPYGVSLGLTCPTSFVAPAPRQWALAFSGATQVINPIQPTAIEICTLTVVDSASNIASITFTVNP